MSLIKYIQAKWFKLEPRHYGVKTDRFDVPKIGEVDFYQWAHPKEPRRIIDPREIDFLAKFISPGDLVIDIGAHCGDTTVPMALVAGNTGVTLALEPNPLVFEVLEKNSQINLDKTNIKPLMFAATEEDGEFVFHYSGRDLRNGGFLSKISRKKGHHFALKVQGRNLSRYLHDNYKDQLTKLSYIKIDAEGFDSYIISTLSEIIAAQKPVIRCEVYKRLTMDERLALFNKLEHFGYKIYRYLDTEFSLGEKLTRQDLNAWPHYDVIASV